MPLTLIATPGAPDANSYRTLDAFAAFLERAGVAASQYTESAQVAALVTATTRLDAERYIGKRATTSQALQWPRRGAVDPDDTERTFDTDEIPWRVENATDELALQILGGADVRAQVSTRTVKRQKIDVIEVEYADTATTTTDLQRWYSAFQWIAPLLWMADTNGDGVPDAGSSGVAAGFLTLRSLR